MHLRVVCHSRAFRNVDEPAVFTYRDDLEALKVACGPVMSEEVDDVAIRAHVAICEEMGHFDLCVDHYSNVACQLHC